MAVAGWVAVHGPVPQASPPQPQVSHSTTSAGTPSVARSAATLWQPHSERGVEPVRSGRFAALTGCQGVRPTRERCFLAARAGCGAATSSSLASLGHFRRFCPIYWHYYLYQKEGYTRPSTLGCRRPTGTIILAQHAGEVYECMSYVSMCIMNGRRVGRGGGEKRRE